MTLKEEQADLEHLIDEVELVTRTASFTAALNKLGE